MIKILLCCGGGFSSSALASRMQKEIYNRDLENEVSISFYPLHTADEVYKNYDIIMCCPHLKMYISSFIEKVHPTIPLYILPPRMYGMMNIEELYQDAKDVIDCFMKTKENPICFPGEENILRVTRSVAYNHQK